LQAELGDLMVSLGYLPSAERLTVVVIKARNLRVVDDTRTSSGMLLLCSISWLLLITYSSNCGLAAGTKALEEHITFILRTEYEAVCSSKMFVPTY
jgi:hypothetical protein